MNKLKANLAPMMNDKNDSRKNDVWRILLFGLNQSAGLSVMHLLGKWAYYTQNVLQLGIFLASVVLFTKLLDAITDPIIANWFDKFDSKYGKFRPIMLTGALLTFIPALIIFLYPVNPTNIPLMATYSILTLMYIIIVIGNTILMTATRAGQAIITQAPEQRPVYALGVTVFDGIVMGFVVIMLTSDLIGGMQDPFVWNVSIIILSVLSLILVAIAMYAIKTRDNPKYYGYSKAKEKVTIIEIFKVIKRNGAMRKLLWAFGTDGFAASARATMSIYLFANIIMQRSLVASVELISAIALGMPAILLGIYLASKKGSAKVFKQVSIIQTFVACLGFFAALLLLSPDPSYTYNGFTFSVFIICLIFGLYMSTLGISTNLVTAMTGDLADYEYSLSGKFIPGTIGATVSFVHKTATSLVGLIVVGIMMFSGFSRVGEGSVVPENVFVNYRFYYSILISVFILPAIGHFISYIAMRKYPITSKLINKISLDMAEERRLK